MEIVWVGVAFVLGFLASLVRLPPLVGYLVAGFILATLGVQPDETLSSFADLGVTLLLFTIGLKLRPASLLKAEVWATASIHMMLTVLAFGLVILLLASTGLAFFTGLNVWQSLFLAFALSFSSTVFAVKVFEETGEMSSLHGRIAIGILIMQDLAAVVFLALSEGKVPSVFALLLIAFIPLRTLLLRLLNHIGHGELLILFGLVLAAGGAEVFELVRVKGDLGALFFGILIASHPRASEMARHLLGLKDLFLVGFFLSVGLTSTPSFTMVGVALLLCLFVVFKLALFFRLLTWLHVNARTAALAALSLANYSEFGLIVTSVGVAGGWIPADWLGEIAIALSFMFIIAAPFNSSADMIYARFRPILNAYESARYRATRPVIDPGDATTVIFGMGRVGTGAYDEMVKRTGDTVLGVDFDQQTVDRHIAAGRNVIRGSATDPEFWDRVSHVKGHHVEQVLLAMPNFRENRIAAKQIRTIGFPVHIAATAKYEDEIEPLKEAGADAVFNLYTEAGAGFVGLACERWQAEQPSQA
jgi:predicted Kef-type K+ transport protein/voltage-gated potassium channel Kch